MDVNLAQYGAAQFITLYAGLIVLGWLLALIVPRILRPVGESNRPGSFGQFAALASGKARYAEAVMADMLASGRLELEGKKFHVRDRQAASGGAETRLMSLGDSFGWRLIARLRRTREGERALKETRQAHVSLKRAPTRDQMGLGVAIFGTAVLAGTPFDPLHAMRQGAGDAGHAANGDGGDGGSGCGGGGCGGCGG